MHERLGLPARATLLSCLGGLSFLAFAFAPSLTETAVANGDTRTIRLYHAHTHESIEATYRVNGQYDPAVLKQLNWFLRDWRRDEPTTMDPRLFDVVWEVYRSAGAGTEPVNVVSAYRSPATNAMLRRRSRAVAEHSQHMLGKAMDTTMPGMSMEQIRETGMRLQRGGVGYYPSAGTPFVHLDVGSVRSWPRMPYDQLARLFPDGKTVHLPTNGQPLARYEEARAEIEAGGAAIAPPSSRSSNFFAWLFGGGTRDGDDEDAAPAAAPRVQTAGRRGRGVQMASALPRGSIPAGASAYSNPDDSGRDFFATAASRANAPAAPAPTPASNLAQAEANLPRGETTLAPAVAAPPERTVVASPAPVTPLAEPSIQSPLVAALADHPAPPRRPTDLISASFDAPMPPLRPVELASFGVPILPSATTAYVGIEPGLRRDPIGRLLDREPTAGIRGANRTGLAPGRPLAVAAIGPMTGLRAARAAAMADIQSPIVPARLDRSNFRAMTAQEPAVRMTTQTVGGPMLSAARSAARADAALLTPVATGAPSTFGSRATDLPTSGFAQTRPMQAARLTPAR